MGNKKYYLHQLADQLNQWGIEIDEMKAKAVKTKSGSRTEILNQIDELRVMRENAQDKLKKFQETGESAWDEMKADLKKSCSEFKGAYSKTLAKLK